MQDYLSWMAWRVFIKYFRVRDVSLVNLLPELSETVAQPEHNKTHIKLADNLGSAAARLDFVANYVHCIKPGQRERQRERERNGELDRRRVEWGGIMTAVNSTDKKRQGNRSSRRAWCAFGHHFLSSAFGLCAVDHARLCWWCHYRLFVVGDNFLTSVAWLVCMRKSVFFGLLGLTLVTSALLFIRSVQKTLICRSTVK